MKEIVTRPKGDAADTFFGGESGTTLRILFPCAKLPALLILQKGYINIMLP